MGRRGSKYCEKCGCYLPKGEIACVSCGYDPTPKPACRPDPLADQASEAFTQLARDHRDAQKQVMLHEILWAKGGKGNLSIIRTLKAEKAFVTSNCETEEVKE